MPSNLSHAPLLAELDEFYCSCPEPNYTGCEMLTTNAVVESGDGGQELKECRGQGVARIIGVQGQNLSKAVREECKSSIMAYFAYILC